jgi:lipopolysaccharide export system permease protein
MEEVAQRREQLPRKRVQMQIINRALLRELTTTTLAVAFIFVALFMVVSLIKILAKAAAGSFPVKFIFTLLGLQTVEILSLMLPLAFYIGLLITLGRWYHDNEMTVLAACGVGLTQLLRPVLLIAAGFAIVVTLLAFYLAPVASRLVAQIKQDDSARYETAAITPGVFNEILQSDKTREGGVYYVENMGPGEVMQKVFVATRNRGRQGVMVAKTGREETDAASGGRFLVLDDGVRYDGTPGQGDYRMVTFARYTIRIETPAPTLRHTSLHAMPTWQVLAEPGLAANAELHWRLSKPIALVLLTLFALVFSHTQPRRGRYVSLFVAIIAYFLYSNLLGVADALLKRGRVPTELGLWWVHAVFLVLGVYLFWRRANNLPLLPALPVFWRRTA